MSAILATVAVEAFVMLIGFIALYLAWTREAFGWALIATVIFSVMVLYSFQIPFQTSADGLILLSPSNFMLAGINMLFTGISLLRTIYLAFEALKGKSSGF